MSTKDIWSPEKKDDMRHIINILPINLILTIIVALERIIRVIRGFTFIAPTNPMMDKHEDILPETIII